MIAFCENSALNKRHIKRDLTVLLTGNFVNNTDTKKGMMDAENYSMKLFYHLANSCGFSSVNTFTLLLH